MKDEAEYINDPLGHTVYLAKNLCIVLPADSLQPYDNLFSVIEHPALLIEMQLETKELFYFRSIDWQLSVLIQAKQSMKGWEAYKCVINPSDGEIVALLQKGKQII